jgi:hypothetical protein
MFFARASLDHDPVAGLRDVYHHTQLLVEMGSHITFLFRLPLKQDPPNLHLPNSWDYRQKPLCLAYSSIFLIRGWQPAAFRPPLFL